MDLHSLLVLPERLAICRLPPDASVPPWAWRGPFVSVTRTPDELSVVCADASVPPGVAVVEGGWRALRVAGTLDFALVGVLARLSVVLAEAGVSLVAISTFDTDYLLVRAADLDHATAALRAAGYEVISGPG